MKNKEVIVPNELTKETKASMKTRIISAAVAIVIAAPLLILGEFFTYAFMTFLLFVGTFEIIHCAKRKYNIALYIVAFILALLLINGPAIMAIPELVKSGTFDWHLYELFDKTYISISIIAFSAFGLFFMILIDKGFTVRDACFIFTMMLIICLGLQSALYIRYIPSKMYHFYNPDVNLPYFNFFDNFESCLFMIYLLLGTLMTDTGAYFVGVFFGKHKMNERISPKKTWEGFWGGIVISSFISFAFGFLFSMFGHPLVMGVLDFDHWYLILILSIVIPFVSTLGDFVFSSVKRFYGIKDFGRIMPGHGGVLDRIDSVIFVLIVAGMFMMLVSYIMRIN